MRRRAWLAPVVVIVLAACSAPAGESPEAPATGRPTFETVAPEASAMAETPDRILDAALAEAADRTGVAKDEIRVVTAEAVTWSDGSLGCPEPGMMYTQALVPGYRVVLEAGGEELHFHAGESGDVRYCEDPRRALEGGGTQ